MTRKTIEIEKLRKLIEDALHEYGEDLSLSVELAADNVIGQLTEDSGSHDEPGENKFVPTGDNFKELLLSDRGITESDKKEWAFWEGVEKTVAKLVEENFVKRISDLHRRVEAIDDFHTKGKMDLSRRLHALESDKPQTRSLKYVAVASENRIARLEQQTRVIALASVVSLVILCGIIFAG